MKIFNLIILRTFLILGLLHGGYIIAGEASPEFIQAINDVREIHNIFADSRFGREMTPLNDQDRINLDNLKQAVERTLFFLRSYQNAGGIVDDSTYEDLEDEIRMINIYLNHDYYDL